MSYYGNKFSQKEHEILKRAAEARKEGKTLPEYDDKGQLINPYIPMYISKVPWYMRKGSEEETGLEHQRQDERQNDSKAHHIRGIIPEAPPRKFRKGACENCGAITHGRKDCLERPRQKGAKWTGKDIQPDEYVQEAALGFEGKRDRWAGYDPDEYAQVINAWEQVEAEKLAARMADKNDGLGGGGEGGSSSSEEDSEGELYAEAVDMPGQKVDLKTRMTVRNLRLREDTVKYLEDLSDEASRYDPKTRSMRKLQNEDKLFVEEREGEVSRKSQLFAWETHSNLPKSIINLDEQLTNPQCKRVKMDQTLMEKYAPLSPDLVRVEESDIYTEFDTTGKVTKLSKTR